MGKYAKKDYPEKECEHCKTMFKPSRITSKYCSRKCNDQAYHVRRKADHIKWDAHLSQKRDRYATDDNFREADKARSKKRHYTVVKPVEDALTDEVKEILASVEHDPAIASLIAHTVVYNAQHGEDSWMWSRVAYRLDSRIAHYLEASMDALEAA